MAIGKNLTDYSRVIRRNKMTMRQGDSKTVRHAEFLMAMNPTNSSKILWGQLSFAISAQLEFIQRETWK